MSPGTSVAHYRVTVKLGQGGMGEVWRATDTRLGREVAIKVLPEAFARDADRLARFQREAQVLASLNHPNIAAIYGVEARALVMELVDGPTLAERIAQGAVPLEEALPIARQIAEALEYAHERGIVHRDLKPANIKIMPENRVKVLDFGLAKAVSSESAAAVDANSPTLTMSATVAGVIMGTAGYMSPEQAKGKPVDRRADIWAFGVVLFEMLTGRPLYTGETVSEVLAAILKDTLDLASLPETTPPAVHRLLRRCLEKDPRRRLQAIGEARIALEEPEEMAPAPPSPNVPVVRARLWQAATAALGIGLLVLSAVHFRQRTPVERPVRFQILPEEGTTFRGQVAVSPDGTQIAFGAAGPGNEVRIWIRPLGSLQARPLAGTERSSAFFWSPDSRFLAFVAGSALSKIDVSGGAPQTICAVPQQRLRGASWGTAGTILLASGDPGLMQVPAAGGSLSPAAVPNDASVYHTPVFLPDGRHFLYFRGLTVPEYRGIYLGSLDDPAGSRTAKPLISTDARSMVYSSQPRSSAGYILFERGETLMAQPFDSARFTLTGDAVPVLSDASMDAVGPVPFSVSSNGVLAHHTGGGQGLTRLLWFDRQGKRLGELGSAGNWNDITVSRDGKTVLVDDNDTRTSTSHLWTVDLARGVFSRLNPGDTPELSGVVSAHGRVAFTSAANGSAGDIYLRLAGGVEPPELLVKSGMAKHPNDWSPDGKYLMYDEHDPKQRQDLWVVPVAGGRKPIPFLVTAADETLGRFSPDGKWVVYSSDESRRREVYVRGFAPDRSPAGAVGQWQISAAGGDKPRWSRDGKEIFYIALDGMMMAVPVKSGTAFAPGVAAPLFRTRPSGYVPYDVTPDGRFLIATLPDDAEQKPSPITVVLNWTAELKR